jgi:subtilisin family serine protease
LGDALESRIANLLASGRFEYVEPDYVVHTCRMPEDGSFADGALWGLPNTGQEGGVAGVDVGAVDAWEVTTGDTGVIVAVIDTGVRYTHQDLAAFRGSIEL